MWAEVAGDLARGHGWQPVYWVGMEAMAGQLAERFPGAVFHSKIDAIKGLPAPACADLPLAPLDQQTIGGLAACEGMTLRMLDRMDPLNSFGFRDRQDLYYRYLGYWLAILERYRPQVAFFPMAPHMGYDYVLYVLCRRRGIPTIMLEQALINSRLYPMASFEDQETVVARHYRRLLAQDSGGEIGLTPEVRQHLEAMTREYQTPFYVSRGDKRRALLPGNWDDLWLQVKSLPRRVLNLGQQIQRLLATPAPTNYMKVRGRPYRGKPISHLGFEYYRWLGRRARAGLKRQYEALASPPSLDQPYVYLPLHYQPEMSTMPTGGYYEDQRVLAGFICSCLPPGWRLLVKEHPVQVSAIGRGQQSRPDGYYQDLLTLPQVSLVPLTHSSYDLSDHAQATATITGQAAWEAVNRSKPALIFGSAWYRGCEGVFFTPTREAFQEALARIRAGYRVDRRKVLLFAKAVEQTAPPSYATPIFGKEYGIGEAENIAVISRLVGDFWQRDILGQDPGGSAEKS
jgi:hypothetical protein